MEPKHLELILEVFADADRNRLAAALRARGLDPLPMKVGFMLSADLDTMRNLQPSLTGTETGDLPVPDEMKDAIRSIKVLKPRSLH